MAYLSRLPRKGKVLGGRKATLKTGPPVSAAALANTAARPRQIWVVRAQGTGPALADLSEREIVEKACMALELMARDQDASSAPVGRLKTCCLSLVRLKTCDCSPMLGFNVASFFPDVEPHHFPRQRCYIAALTSGKKKARQEIPLEGIEPPLINSGTTKSC